MGLTPRQLQILEVVKANGPISGDDIALQLALSKSTLRSDLSILTHTGYLDAKQKVGYVIGSPLGFDGALKSYVDVQVKDVMAVPEVIDVNLPIYEALATIFLANVGSVYVIKDKCLAGVVTRTDLIKSLMGGTDIRNMPVGIIMTRVPNVVWVTPETTVVEAARLIVTHQIDSLPVVRNELNEGINCYRVVGRFSKTIVTRLFVEATGG